MELIGYDGKPYEKRYDPERGEGWVATHSALCGVVSVHGREVFTRFVSPTTGDCALIYLTSEFQSVRGMAYITKRQNGVAVNHFPVNLVDFIRGDYKLPEKGE